MFNRASHLFDRAETDGGKIALIFERERYTFAELATKVRAAAGGLARLGIGKGTHVGIMIPSSPDFIIVQQALFALGAVVSPLNIFYRPGEVAHAVQSCDLDYLVMSSELLERVPPGSAETSPLRAVILTDNGGETSSKRALSLPDAIADGQPLTALMSIAEDDVAVLLLTSATTGKSKGVMLSAGNLASNYDRTPEWLGLGGDAVILCALPLYNTFGLNQCINAMLVTGATLVLLPRFDAKRCIEAIGRHHCTFLPAVPTMLQKIVDHPDARIGALSSIACIMTGGAPVPAALLRRVLGAVAADAEVLTGYGLTEATALVTLTPVRLGIDGDVEHGRTIGRVLDGMELGIMADDGRLLDVGTVGEIVVRGRNVMSGYYSAPDDTAAALADGWLRSGDLGYVDADGYAFIVDRKKDIIIRGGQNIYPADIEEVLYQVPGVAEAAVVGISDDILGEVPIAFVALASASNLSPSALIEHCKAELAHYKVPAVIHILAELPKGPTGKILRRALRDTMIKDPADA
jgi:long-chain acyl-CoA synthetase